MRNFSCLIVEGNDHKLKLKKMETNLDKNKNIDKTVKVKNYNQTSRSSQHNIFPMISDNK